MHEEAPPIATVNSLEIDPALKQGLEPFFASPVKGDRFCNPWEHEVHRSFRDVLRWKLQSRGNRGQRSERPQVPVFSDAASVLAGLSHRCRLWWLGHASFYVELDGLRIMIDPIIGKIGGVIKRLTPLPVPVDCLPTPEVVLLTHGHFDHTDAATIRLLCAKAERDILFVVPRGLSAVLPRCCRRVVELSWWESLQVGGVQVVLVPAQHWHRRALRDEDRSLWGGYVLRASCTLYHSGDTAFFGGFEAIARVFGSIDLACLPIGAYEPRWFMGGQHMAPEEALRAFRILGAAHFVAMHWGTYQLSDEPIDAGPQLLNGHCQREEPSLRQRIHVLQPGGVIGYSRGEPLVAVGVLPEWR